MAITKVPKVMTTDLDQVDNTSDLDKPISTATQTALNAKQATITGGTANQLLVKNSATEGDFSFQTITPGFPVGGTDGQLLVKNSADPSGASWSNTIPVGYAFGSQQIFTSTQIYTPSANCRALLFECVGGGGAGGGAAITSSGFTSVGGGGGGGGYARAFIQHTGTTYTLTIGAAGTGVSGTTGNSGGTSSVYSDSSATTIIQGNGGSGSGMIASSSSQKVTNNGAGGTGSGVSGGLFVRGSFGGLGFSTVTITLSGNGGNSFYGSGGDPVGATTGQANGSSGNGYGSGGSGAVGGSGTTTAATGGNGTPGVIIVYEYY